MTNRLFFAAAAGVLALDQATKALVVRRMPLHSTVELAPFFSLTHVQNTGAAFGLYPQGNAFFIAATFGILVLLAVLHKKIASDGLPAAAGLSLLWGGALGNLADRLRQGCVTDFLDFHVRGWHWPAFNVADSAICAGVGLMILDSFRPHPAPAAVAPVETPPKSA